MGAARGGGIPCLLLLLALLLLPGSAGAFPFVGLFLEGEAEELGLGGEPFRNLHLEATRLRRPASLGTSARGFAALDFHFENTLRLRTGDLAGTKIRDNQLRARAYLPLGQPIDGLALGVFTSFEHATSTLIVRNEGQTLLDLRQDRTYPSIGVAASLPWAMQVAAGVDGFDAGALRWLLELRMQPLEGLDLWVLRREEGSRQTASVPSGAAPKVHSPQLHFPLDLQRTEVELGAGYETSSFWSRGGATPDRVGSFWLEVGGRPWAWVALRAGADSDPFRLRDSLVAQGTGEVAEMDLYLRRTRGFAGADFSLGPRDLIRTRYIYSSFGSRTLANEVGTNAAQAFLHVDTDLGLLFEGDVSLRTHQLGVGWGRDTTAGLRFAVGAQYLHASVLPSELALDSHVMDRPLAGESIEGSSAHLLGLTGFVEVPVGAIRLGLSVGQLLPLAVGGGEDPGRGGEPGKPGGRKPSPGAFEWLGRTAAALRDTTGGTRILLQATVDL